MIRKTSGPSREPAGWLVLLGFALGTVLLYFPVLGNGFLTDDYAALYRLLIEKRVIYQDMMRPLIDVSFYLNWFFFKLHPTGYYLFNFSVHALVCYMVYRVALDLPLFAASVGQRVGFALTAGVLFLFYPFHNEGVVWLSGRLSSMAALFGLLAIHISLTRRGPWGTFIAVLLWFTGLFAYESIIVLPALVLLLEWICFRDWARTVRSGMGWMAAGILWLVMRFFVAGGLFPTYVRGGVESDRGLLRFAKVLGRCFLPPTDNILLLEGLFIGLAIAVLLLHILFWRRLARVRRVGVERRKWPLLGLEVGFFIALLPAIAFGVSTRTSEGDRLLYFPSCFLCLLVSALLFFFFPRRRWRLLVCAVVALASVFFIEGNNQKWVFASSTAAAVLDTVRAAPGRVVLVDAPDEWEGAFIFRNNFEQMLRVNGIDAGKVVVAHFLLRKEYLPVGGRIVPERRDSGVFVYPSTLVVREGERFRVSGLPGSARMPGIAETFSAGADRVYYWDKFGLKPLILDQQ